MTRHSPRKGHSAHDQPPGVAGAGTHAPARDAGAVGWRRAFAWFAHALLGWCLGLAAPLLHAAEPHPEADAWEAHADPVFTNFLRDAGLPAVMFITAMAQDAQGFLWIGTQSGVIRWDGYRHRMYAEDANAPGGLLDGYVNRLHVDPRGRLWVGTSAGGLARFDATTDRFVTASSGLPALSHSSVFSITDDGENGLWIGTGAGLDHLGSDGTTVQRHAEAFAGQGLPDASVMALLRDRDGGLWVGTRKGLFLRRADAARFEPVALAARQEGTPIISELMQDAAGRVWVGTRSRGAYVVAPGEQVATPVQEEGSTELQSDFVFGLLEVTPGRVWIATSGNGIVDIDTATGRTRRLRHRERVPGSLADDDINLLFRDRSGLVWVGSDAGLSAHDPAQRAVRTWFGYVGNATGISHNNVPYVLGLPDGRVWLSLGDGGVDIVDPRRGRVAQLRVDPLRPLTALPKGRVLTMARSSTGVFLGTQEGLYHADADGRNVSRLSIPGRDPTAATWALHARGDRLWVGGGDGLWDLRLQAAGPAEVVGRHDAASLGDARVVSFYLAPDGMLWVGTRAGLARYDIESRRVDRPLQEAPGRAGTQRGYITTVFHDRQGRLWVASYGGGVRVVEPAADGRTPTIHRIGLAEGLPNNGINAMLLDGEGDVWLSTDDGLARVAARDLSVTALRPADGVSIQSYWSNSAAVAADGALLFGGTGGLTVVNPTAVAPWPYAAPVVVTQVQVGDDPVVTGPLVATALSQATFAPGHRDVSVEFSALDYSAPGSNRYAYRLAGFDRDWIATDSSRRQAHYTNLPPGDYVLELRGSNRQGVWSEPLRWPVSVRAAWYETSALRGVLGLLALTLVVGVVQGRTLVLRRRQQALEALVAQRTARLAESEARLQQLAFFDELTGLLNRRRFNEEFLQLQARARRGEPFSLLLIDLDRFKQVNDTHGHDAGDALLVAMGGRLTRAVRDVDRVARLGGDEFAVLVAGTVDPGDVETICSRILEQLAAPVPFEGGALQVSCSVGIAAFPQDAADVAELYKAADLALYNAKEAGRNAWRWYQPALRIGAAANEAQGEPTGVRTAVSGSPRT